MEISNEKDRSSARRWAVVLAGGEGTRMRDWIARRVGRPVPKQYCTFTGDKSMLEHTFDRAVAAVGEEHVVTVIAAHHWDHLAAPRRIEIPGTLAVQPKNRDTAAGLLLPLTGVLARDSEATVAVLPADHFIRPNARFQEHLGSAFRLAERFTDKAVLLAARPDRAESDYGWISPAGYVFEDGRPMARTVEVLIEKPAAAEAQALYRAGASWNTMIVVAKARTLWDMTTHAVPALGRRFTLLRQAHEAAAAADLEALYADMPAASFSADVLERLPERLLALPLNGVHWCDWGRPERVTRSLEEIARAKRPAFGRPPAKLFAPT